MEQKIETSSLNQKIESLFNEKMNQQSKNQAIKERVKQQYQSQQTYLFYGNFQEEINIAKHKICKVLQDKLSFFTIQQIKKIRSKILPLLRDLRYLLDDGILDFFYQFSEMEKQTQIQQVKLLAKKMMEISEPIVRKFFIHKQFVRMKASQKSNAVKKQQFQRRSSRKKSTMRNSNSLTIKIQAIQELYEHFTVEQLIQKHLENQQQSIDNILETCRICKKKIKLDLLLKHLHFCEKRQSFKKKIYELREKINNILFSLNKRSLIINYSKNLTEQQISFEAIYKKILKESKTKNHQPRRNSVSINKGSIQSTFQIARDINSHIASFGMDADLEMYRRLKQEKEYILRKIQKLQKREHDGSESCGSFQSFSSSRESNKQNMTEKKGNYKKSAFIQKQQSSSSQSQESQISIDNQRELQQTLKIKKKKKTIRLNRLLLGSVYTGRSKSSQSHCQKSSSEFQKNQIQINHKTTSKKQIAYPRKISYRSQFYQKNELEEKIQENKPSRFKNSLANKKKTTINDTCQDNGVEAFVPLNRTALSYEQLPNILDRQEVSQTLNNFQFLSFLGKGAFGKVYLARRRDTFDLYAIKIIIMQESWEQSEMKLIKNEYQTFKHIGGQHLVKAPFAFSSYNGFFFVMQYMPGGDLGKLLSQEVFLQQDKAKFYLAEIVLAIQLLHQYKIIHRDLKPENLVFDSKGHLKLTDFGLSELRINDKIAKVKRSSDQYKMQITKKRNDKKRRRRSALVQGKQQIRLIGTPDYIAPQIINGTSTTNETIDWWSFGVMAYQILIGARPFAGDTIQQVIQNIIQYKIQWPEVGHQQGMISPQAQDLILKLTQRNYMTRLGSNGTQQIKNHPFFKGINWQNIMQQDPPQRVFSSIGLDIYDQSQNKDIRQQIQNIIGYQSQRGSTQSKCDSSNSNKSKFRLSNFVRYDILQYQTFESAEKMLNKKNTKIKKLKSLMDNFKEKNELQPFIKIQEMDDSHEENVQFDKFKSSNDIHLTKDEVL